MVGGKQSGRHCLALFLARWAIHCCLCSPSLALLNYDKRPGRHWAGLGRQSFMLGTGVEEENEQQPHSIRRRRHRDYDEEDDEVLWGLFLEFTKPLALSASQSVSHWWLITCTIVCCCFAGKNGRGLIIYALAEAVPETACVSPSSVFRQRIGPMCRGASRNST